MKPTELHSWIFVPLALLVCGCSAPKSSFQQANQPVATLIAPDNDLETALLKAAAEPSFRPAFERQFLAADVVMRTNPALVPEIQKAIGPDGKLTRKTDIQVWAFEDELGQLVVPMFTSPARMKSVYPGQPWVRLKGREALRMAASHTVIINPSMAPQVTWTPADIGAIRSLDDEASD